MSTTEYADLVTSPQWRLVGLVLLFWLGVLIGRLVESFRAQKGRRRCERCGWWMRSDTRD